MTYKYVMYSSSILTNVQTQTSSGSSASSRSSRSHRSQLNKSANPGIASAAIRAATRSAKVILSTQLEWSSRVPWHPFCNHTSIKPSGRPPRFTFDRLYASFVRVRTHRVVPLRWHALLQTASKSPFFYKTLCVLQEQQQYINCPS